MKRLVLLVVTILVGSTSFAGLSSSGLHKNSPQLKALSSTWNTPHRAIHPQSKDEITMVYGGADISRKPTIAYHTATA